MLRRLALPTRSAFRDRSGRSIGAAATALVVMSLLAACSSEGGYAESPTEPSPTTVSSTIPSPTTTSAPASATNSLSVPVATPPSAQNLLLSAAQLPGAGWTPQSDTDPEATELQETTQPECSNQSWILRSAGMTDMAGASWTFDAAAEVETISSQAFVYPDAAAATAALASYRDLVGRCTSWQSVLTSKGYTYAETQEMFDASVGEESVARQTGTSHVRLTDLPTFRMYWVTSRVGQTIVQVTYRPGSLLGTDQGRDQALELASTAGSTAENRTK
ncbi:sensor domain-containing protein [Rhodococcus sp. IEGM 1241]|uniref:sensor domain-containing protein n=1 Tax=Rhodococcus sp. IEGM 1241 TaxID=3082228 RepID=UPI002954F1F5|nr:sensor domain-containing protein [Rhodococcus sp. IEGM 1241]MDV8015949.1 sensor domain-containing protein [Rhodococcus sp. IEGM 1241]